MKKTGFKFKMINKCGWYLANVLMKCLQGSAKKETLLAAFLGMSMASGASHAFSLTTQLTGDPRDTNPDGIVIDVTITVDEANSPSTANWVVDLNSSDHSSAKLLDFYFNMNGPSSNYTFTNFTPESWTVTTGSIKPKGAGSGGATFEFNSSDGKDPKKTDVTNSQSLSFDMNKLSGVFLESDFLLAPKTLLTGLNFQAQLGAHVGGLGNNGNLSGFAVANYDPEDPLVPTTDVPLPSVLLLMVTGLLGLALPWQCPGGNCWLKTA